MATGHPATTSVEAMPKKAEHGPESLYLPRRKQAYEPHYNAQGQVGDAVLHSKER